MNNCVASVRLREAEPSFQRSYYERYTAVCGEMETAILNSSHRSCCPGSGDPRGSIFIDSLMHMCELCDSAPTPERDGDMTLDTRPAVGDPSHGPKRRTPHVSGPHPTAHASCSSVTLTLTGSLLRCLMYRSLTLAHSCPTLALALSSRDCGCTVPWHVCVVYSCTAVHS